MLGGHGDVGGTQQGVGAGGEHPKDAGIALRELVGEADSHAVAFADPVFLHQLDLFRPAGQLVEFGQQLLGVLRDRHVIHGNLALFHHRAGPPATPVDHLFVGEHGLIHRIPIHHAGFQIGNAFFQHPQEQPLVPAVILGLTSCQFAVPVQGEAERLELLFHVGDVVVGPSRRRDTAGHRGVLGGQPESVPTHRLQYVPAQHPLITRDHITDGVVADMAHVQPPTGIRKHAQAVIFLAAGLLAHGEDPLFIPMVLRFRFDDLRVVRLGDHDGFPILKRKKLV